MKVFIVIGVGLLLIAGALLTYEIKLKPIEPVEMGIRDCDAIEDPFAGLFCVTNNIAATSVYNSYVNEENSCSNILCKFVVRNKYRSMIK